MSDTVTITALQARRALTLARWMTRRGGDQRTRLRCHDLVRALESALGDTTNAYKEQRRAEWRAASARHRERKRAAS
jgi:hypothetical protein